MRANPDRMKMARKGWLDFDYASEYFEVSRDTFFVHRNRDIKKGIEGRFMEYNGVHYVRQDYKNISSDEYIRLSDMFDEAIGILEQDYGIGAKSRLCVLLGERLNIKPNSARAALNRNTTFNRWSTRQKYKKVTKEILEELRNGNKLKTKR